jgi:hypothetical protein
LHEKSETVATVTLNKLQALNAINETVGTRELAEMLTLETVLEYESYLQEIAGATSDHLRLELSWKKGDLFFGGR